jgi:hypothetical protein
LQNSGCDIPCPANDVTDAGAVANATEDTVGEADADDEDKDEDEDDVASKRQSRLTSA